MSLIMGVTIVLCTVVICATIQCISKEKNNRCECQKKTTKQKNLLQG